MSKAKRHKEWEAKCHRCGKCCMDKILLADAIVYTGGKCPHLGPDNLCTVYENRFEVEPSCIKLTPANVKKFKWLSPNCGLKA